MWHEFGDMSGLGALATKDSASGSFTPQGSVSQPSFTGSEMTSEGKFTPSGSVSAPSISVTPTTDTVEGMASVGSLPSLSMSVSNENLTIAFDPGSLPTKDNQKTFMTGASASASQPEFTGTEDDVEVKGTPSGSVSQPSFTGTSGTVTVS